MYLDLVKVPELLLITNCKVGYILQDTKYNILFVFFNCTNIIY